MVVQTVFICLTFSLIGYLCGSVLFGAIIAKMTNINVREIGSQNVGGTNVSRALGKKIGILVSLLDAIKSYLAIIFCWIIFRYSIFDWDANSSNLYWTIYLAGVFTVVGHCWPLLYLFKLFKTKFNRALAKAKSGGKGVATSGGVLFAMSPWLGLLSFGIFVVILLITRYVSISSTICMFMPAFSVFLVGMDYFYLFDHSLLFQTSFEPDIVERVIFMVMILCNSLIVIIRHIPNIIRLSKHEEKKVFHGKV